MTDVSQVTNNAAAEQYEVHLDGKTAFAAYKMRGDQIIFTHTEVPEELEGHGVGSTLVRSALDDARERHLSVVPLCPFMVAFIKRHQEYVDIVRPEYRSHVGHEE